MNLKIILATASPYRKETFKNIGYKFTAEASNIDEKFSDRPDNPEELVKLLVRLKSEYVAKDHKEGIIIGFDSIGYFKGEILEKPTSREEAFSRLKNLSGNSYSFYTGIHVIDKHNGKIVSDFVETKAYMRNISEKEINTYLDSDPKYKTYAQGFDPVKGLGSTFIKRIEGSYLNILQGIPLERIKEIILDIEKCH